MMDRARVRRAYFRCNVEAGRNWRPRSMTASRHAAIAPGAVDGDFVVGSGQEAVPTRRRSQPPINTPPEVGVGCNSVSSRWNCGAGLPLQFFVRAITTPIGPTTQTRKCGGWIVSRLLSASVITTINHARLRETCTDLDNVLSHTSNFVWRIYNEHAAPTAGRRCGRNCNGGTYPLSAVLLVFGPMSAMATNPTTPAASAKAIPH